MQDFPHHYLVDGRAAPEGDVTLTSPGLEALASAAPEQFGGPGDKWSPETLLTAAVADCFILGFRAIARASKFQWHALSCIVEGTLERKDHVSRFTAFTVRARLEVPADADEARATRLLEKADATCLVTNSLSSEIRLETEVKKTDEP